MYIRRSPDVSKPRPRRSSEKPLIAIGFLGMRNFAASNAYVAAAHDLIPGGAHTYAKGDDHIRRACHPL